MSIFTVPGQESRATIRWLQAASLFRTREGFPGYGYAATIALIGRIVIVGTKVRAAVGLCR